MNGNYPVQQKNKPYRQNQQRSPVPVVGSGFVPTTVVPKNPIKGRNVAGRVKTTMHLKDRNGNEMTITQYQEVLNLMDGAKGFWSVGNQGNNHGGGQNGW